MNILRTYVTYDGVKPIVDSHNRNTREYNSKPGKPTSRIMYNILAKTTNNDNSYVCFTNTISMLFVNYSSAEFY